MLAAPASGQGKTVITAALLALLRRRGVAVAAAKVGPDYIDPAFHAVACGRQVINLDPWAMSRGELLARLARQAQDAEMLIIEGVMGLFDGAALHAPAEARPANLCTEAEPEAQASAPNAAALTGIGASADLAAMFDIPVVLVLDASRMGASAAALVHGFASLRPDVRVAGVILNRLGTPRHGELLAHVIEEVTGLPVVGRFLRDETLALPSRHLGLVPAGEHADLAPWLERAADIAADSVALCRLANLTRPLTVDPASTHPALPPLGQRIAIARDAAFCFAYPHLLMDWRAVGAELTFFSPLANEAPDAQADAVFLPGGYPELHAARLAAAETFRHGMHDAAARGALIYGECGGFMTLGQALVDAEGGEHAMCGLLPLVTSFAKRRLHLGYRRLAHDGALPWPRRLRGHEFHYATVVHQGEAAPLFSARDATGNDIGSMGLRVGNVMGSFAHVIAAEETP